MEKLKKALRVIFFMPLALDVVLFLVSIGLLTYSFMFEESASLISIISYALSAYSLSALCVKIPDMIKLTRRVLSSKPVERWRSDVRLRVNVTLLASSIFNMVYAIFQLCLGIWHATLWFLSFAAYYFILAAMRFSLFTYTRRCVPGEDIRAELKKYLSVGISLIFVNTALSSISFFMVWQNRTFVHHEITTIAMAAYTFTSLTFAIINVFKYRKYKSPVLSASRAIGLTSAIVSMLTLEASMLTAFGADMEANVRRLFLALSGGVVAILIITVAIGMTVRAIRETRRSRGMSS